MTVNFNLKINNTTTRPINELNYNVNKLSENSIFGPSTKNEDIKKKEKKLQETESGLRNKIPGYLILTDKGRVDSVGKSFSGIKDNQKLRAKIDEYAEYIKTENDAKIIVKTHAYVNNKDAVYIMDKLTRHSKHGAKAVARESVNVDKKIQAEVVGKTQNLKYGTEFQKEIDRIIIEDNYGNYDKSQEVEIHKIMSQSKFEETVKKAAENIYKLHEENRNTAAEITKNTGNANAIASIEVESPDEIKTDTYLSNKDLIEQAINSNDEKTIKICLEKMSSTEIFSFVKNNKEAIGAILASNPKISVINEINKLARNSNLINYNMAKKELGFFDLTIQKDLVKQAAANNDLGAINRKVLNNEAKRKYDELSTNLKINK